MRTLAKIMLALCLLFAFVSAVSALPAGTPDGVPPSQATDCDGQTGAAHGLCTAYCDAMDCASANPQASPKACAKVFANYQKITGNVPPCANVCPCVSVVPGFSDSLNVPATFCVDQTDPNGFITVFVGNESSFWPFAVYQPGPDTSSFCGNFLGSTNVLEISDSQALLCQDLIRQSPAVSGVACSH